MSYRDPRTGRIIDDQRQYTPTKRDINRAAARRKAEQLREELDLARQYDLGYYGSEDE